MQRQVTPPYCPNIADKKDVGHFEKTFTREQAIDSTASGKGPGGNEEGGFFNIFQFFGTKQSPGQGGAADGSGAKAVKRDDVFADFTYESPSALAIARSQDRSADHA